MKRFDDLGHIATPDAQRRPVDLKATALEDRLQPVKRKVITELAGDHEGQQPRPRQSLVDRLSRFIGSLDVRIGGILFAVSAGVLEADIFDPLESAGDVLDLPACFAADAISPPTATEAGLLIFREVVFFADQRKLI